MTISFTIPFVAVFERPRPGRNGGYYNPHEKIKKTISWIALEARQKELSPLLVGDLSVNITCFGFNRKDIDNAVKLILDACNKVIWEDDDQVCLILARKIRVGEPRMEVDVREM